jgi:hypothetical protein
MDINESLVAQGAAGFIALQLQVMEQALKIQFLMQVLAARIDANDSQLVYQNLEKDSRVYVEAHGEHLAKLRELLKTLEKVLPSQP